MLFIGDVHGKFEQYLTKLGTEPSLQIGDMGLGFGDRAPTMAPQHKFLRGNHDDPGDCILHPNYAGEFGYWDDNPGKEGLFFCGGAFSIDKEWRIEYQRRNGQAIWWPDEELSEGQLEQAIQLYEKTKPEIVATHDCPESIGTVLLTKVAIGWRPEKRVRTRTGVALQRMLERHMPKVWIFGHYHIDADFTVGATRFVCLNELSTLTL